MGVHFGELNIVLPVPFSGGNGRVREEKCGKQKNKNGVHASIKPECIENPRLSVVKGMSLALG